MGCLFGQEPAAASVVSSPSSRSRSNNNNATSSLLLLRMQCDKWAARMIVCNDARLQGEYLHIKRVSLDFAIQHSWLKTLFGLSAQHGTQLKLQEHRRPPRKVRPCGSGHILLFSVSSCASQQDSKALKGGRLAKASIAASLSLHVAPLPPKGCSQVTANPL